VAGGDDPIVIGAKDEATRVMRDVAAQLARLTSAVEQSAPKTAAKVQQVEFSFKALASAAAPLAAIFAVVRGAMLSFETMGSSVEAFNVQQEAVRGLSLAIRDQVGDVDAAVAAHADFAARMQVATNVGDEATLGLMRQASMMGINAEQVDSAAAAAIGLANALGISQEEALKKVTQAVSGNSSALGEFIPNIGKAKTEAERFQMVLDLAGRGLADAEDRTKTTAGMMDRAGGAIGDLKEKLGELLAPFWTFGYEVVAVAAESLQTALLPAIDAVQAGFDAVRPILDAVLVGVHDFGVIVGVVFEVASSVIGTLTDALGLNQGTLASWGETLQSIIRWVGEGLIAGLTMAEVVLTNLPDVLEFVAAAAELWAIRLSRYFEQALTVDLPAILEFATGISESFWKGLIEGSAAAGDVMVDVLLYPWQRLAEYLPGVMKGVQAAVGLASRGQEVVFDFVAEEFAGLPEKAANAATARERELLESMGRIATNLGEEFDAKFSERVARLGVEARQGMSRQLGETAKELQQKQARGGIAPTSLSAVESRLLVRGRTDDPLLSVASNTARTADAVLALPDALAALMRPDVGLPPLQVRLVQ